MADTNRALAWRRYGGVEQHLAQCLMRGEQIRKPTQVPLDLSGIGLLETHLEEGPGVTRCGRAVRHGSPAFHADDRKLSDGCAKRPTCVCGSTTF